MQVLTILHEVFPAVKAAEMAVKFRPLWWEGWQTLGRAQLNLGEVDLVSNGSSERVKGEYLAIQFTNQYSKSCIINSATLAKNILFVQT